MLISQESSFIERFTLYEMAPTYHKMVPIFKASVWKLRHTNYCLKLVQFHCRLSTNCVTIYTPNYVSTMIGEIDQQLLDLMDFKKIKNVLALDALCSLYFIADPPNLLKTIRNCWFSSKWELTTDNQIYILCIDS